MTLSLVQAVEKCRDTFLSYERLHLAKGTPESDAKAKVNALLAAECQQSLDAAARPVPTMSDGRAPTVLNQDQLNELGQRLLALTPNGSEYFSKHGDGYKVDVDACVNFIERQKRALWGRLAPPPTTPAPITATDIKGVPTVETVAGAYNWLSGGYPAQAQDFLRNALLAAGWKINDKFPWSYQEYKKP